MTHDERVLELLSDGEPHSHHELYQLYVIAHSRVASLRKKGHVIECWREDDTYYYQLQLLSDGGGSHRTEAQATRLRVPLAPAITEQPDGQLALHT